MTESVPEIKGSNVLMVVKALRKARAFAEPLLTPQLRPYLSRRVLVGSWYPEADHYALLRVLVRLMPEKPPECWRSIGRDGARGHVAGPYAGMVLGGPLAYVRSLPAQWRLHHTTGDWETAALGDKHHRLSLSSYAVGMPEIGAIMEGYFVEVLKLAGAAAPHAACLDQGPSAATWEIHWESAH